MLSGRSFDDEAWSLLTTIIELSRQRLRFVLVECESDGVRAALREKLQAYCVADGRPCVAPERDQDVLGWLIAQQRESAELPPTERERVQPVRFFPVPTGEDETFTLYRLNENRDNLKRDLRGVLVLVGLTDFLRRVPHDAPDLWSMREKTFEVSARDLPPIEEQASLPIEEMALKTLPSEPAKSHSAPKLRYDVFLSYAYADREIANALRARLEKDGVDVFIEDPSGNLDKKALAESRFIMPLLSTNYVRVRWPNIERELFSSADNAELVRRSLPMLVSAAVTPNYFRQFHPIDWTSAEKRERSYPDLLRVLQGRGRELKSPAREEEEVEKFAEAVQVPTWPWQMRNEQKASYGLAVRLFFKPSSWSLHREEYLPDLLVVLRPFVILILFVVCALVIAILVAWASL